MNDEIERDQLRAKLSEYESIGTPTRLKIIAEDLRVTNESADFHMKLCNDLRAKVEELEKRNVVMREALLGVMDAHGRHTICECIICSTINKALSTTPVKGWF